VQRSGSPSPAVQRLLAEEGEVGLGRIEYYRDFADRVRSIQTRLRELLESLKADGKRIAGYGVAAKGAILLNSAGIGEHVLDYAVDRNVQKQGKYLPGVHLLIYGTSKLLEPPTPDYVLLLAWNLKDEIMLQQQEFSRRGGSFIIPIPFPEIVTEPRHEVASPI
jgi:C-methyltransferase C-terminal domain